jgi:hypothetical protein
MAEALKPDGAVRLGVGAAPLAAGGTVGQPAAAFLLDGDLREVGRVLGGELRTD